MSESRTRTSRLFRLAVSVLYKFPHVFFAVAANGGFEPIKFDAATRTNGWYDDLEHLDKVYYVRPVWSRI